MTEGQGASHIVEGRQAEGSRGPCHREPVTGAQGQQVPSQQGEQGGRTETRQRLRGGLRLSAPTVPTLPFAWEA